MAVADGVAPGSTREKISRGALKQGPHLALDRQPQSPVAWIVGVDGRAVRVGLVATRVPADGHQRLLAGRDHPLMQFRQRALAGCGPLGQFERCVTQVADDKHMLVSRQRIETPEVVHRTVDACLRTRRLCAASQFRNRGDPGGLHQRTVRGHFGVDRVDVETVGQHRQDDNGQHRQGRQAYQ